MVHGQALRALVDSAYHEHFLTQRFISGKISLLRVYPSRVDAVGVQLHFPILVGDLGSQEEDRFIKVG